MTDSNHESLVKDRDGEATPQSMEDLLIVELDNRIEFGALVIDDTEPLFDDTGCGPNILQCVCPPPPPPPPDTECLV